MILIQWYSTSYNVHIFQPNSRFVRRTQSFNVKPEPTSGSGQDSLPVMATKADNSPDASPASRRKKHKALLVKKVPATDIEDPLLTGYMERRSISEQWLK